MVRSHQTIRSKRYNGSLDSADGPFVALRAGPSAGRRVANGPGGGIIPAAPERAARVASTEEEVWLRDLGGSAVCRCWAWGSSLACSQPPAAARPRPRPPRQAPPADGTGIDGVWLLTDYVSVDGTNFTVPSSVTPNIRFDGNAASGQAGCNTFNAIANINGDELRFEQVQASELPCEDPMATVEFAFMQALNLSTT